MGSGLSDLEETILTLAYQRYVNEGRYHPATVILEVWVAPSTRAAATAYITQLVPHVFLFPGTGDRQQGMSQLKVRLIGLDDHAAIRGIQQQLGLAGYPTNWQRVAWEPPDAGTAEVIAAFYADKPLPAAAQIDVYRAYAGLQERGLVTRPERGTGVNLTPAGVDAARTLLANSQGKGA